MTNIQQKIYYLIANTWLAGVVHNVYGFIELNVMKTYKDKEFIDLLKEIRKESRVTYFPSEGYILYSLSKKQTKIPGDYAEVGCYEGSSAKMICGGKGSKPIHLFDTFDGNTFHKLSQVDTLLREKKYEFKSNQEYVTKRLLKYKNIFIYKGIFPKTSEPIKNKRFSFVHFDADSYAACIDFLEFFYPRMNKGGIILAHDYPICEGVKKAFDEFFKNKTEDIIDLPMTQCRVIKV